MRCKQLVFISVLALLLVLAGCSKAECKKDVDCQKPHYTGACVDKKCSYAPIPNECGNGECESSARENKCTCADDCGICEGKSGKYLEQTCNKDKECVEDIPATAQKPITLTKELSTGGTKLSLTTIFSQPFNLKKDQFGLEFGINVLAAGMSDVSINRLELTGVTPDKRTVPLSDKTVSIPLYEGSKRKEKLIIDFPTADRDGELSNLNLKIYVDYVLTSGSSTAPKSGTLQNSYSSLKFAWARPEKSPGCPASCDDGNPGTDDVCDAGTNYFCENRPKAGACGNGVCDGAENKCTCAGDCGPCTGGGTYLARSCVASACVAQLKPGITVQPQSVFDERDLSVFTLQNNYKFNKPFNTKSDKLALEFSLYQKDDKVASVTLKDARLLDGTQEVAAATIGKQLTTAGQKETADIAIPAGGAAEQERTLTLRVWYEYVEDGTTKQADFSKPLGKLVLLNPDV